MLKKPSLITRIYIGKGTGFLFGLLGFLMIPMVMPETPMIFRVAILLWYPTVGAFVAFVGVFSKHPVLKCPLHWWYRSILVGAWMNLVVVLFAYETFADVLYAAFGSDGNYLSPYWFVLEGAIIALIIDFLATKYGGEGKETLKKDFK